MERPDRTGGGVFSACARCELWTDPCRICKGLRKLSSQDDDYLRTAIRNVQFQHEEIDTKLNRSSQREPGIPTRP